MRTVASSTITRALVCSLASESEELVLSVQELLAALDIAIVGSTRRKPREKPQLHAYGAPRRSNALITQDIWTSDHGRSLRTEFATVVGFTLQRKNETLFR